MMNSQVFQCFIIPPPPYQPHSSWRAILYANDPPPKKTFIGYRTLPSEFSPDDDLMKKELSNSERESAYFIRFSDEEQYIHIEGDTCEVIGTEISNAEGFIANHLKDSPNASDPSLGNKWMIVMNFKTHPTKNQEIIDKVSSLLKETCSLSS